MKHVIVSIYDKATEAYMRPWTALTDKEAIRSFEQEATREGSPIAASPQDYTLFHLGTWNDAKAEILTVEPVPLRRAHEINKDK